MVKRRESKCPGVSLGIGNHNTWAGRGFLERGNSSVWVEREIETGNEGMEHGNDIKRKKKCKWDRDLQ